MERALGTILLGFNNNILLSTVSKDFSVLRNILRLIFPSSEFLNRRSITFSRLYYVVQVLKCELVYLQFGVTFLIDSRHPIFSATCKNIEESKFCTR